MQQERTPHDLTPKDVAPHIYKWSREELEQMQAMIAGQLQAIRETNRSETQRWQSMGEATNRGPVEWNPF
ncbi:hypothetical protein [Aerosakkonema funiforme]|uniref:Uncharacterized protein n=1 Tax=Aerosakkonema funiforme FACHB-1375 TaxID=2949571 RepID=A0A926VKX4_9CYAN|nr:hypothetical protein [Aerosakkonema funiforme]MBD2185593.1 hypothetical protein [Aerosakkonema funiforme FACHB-1375]